MSDFLYGTDIDDELDQRNASSATPTSSSRPRLPLSGHVWRHTVMPRGEAADARIMSAGEILDHIVDCFGDDCGFEQLYEQYDEAKDDPDVIAAFQAARDLLVSKQRFRIADQLDARATFTITAVDETGIPTYTIGDWEPA